MPPPRAASGNAALTARLYLGRQHQAAEARYTMPEGDGQEIPSSVATTPPAVTQRLPSARPIDHRWDRSRGIIFNDVRRTVAVDHTWCRGNGITFAATPPSSRSYATRPLFQSPERHKPPPPMSRQESLVNNPNKVPTFSAPPQTEQVQKLAELEKEKAAVERKLAESRSEYGRLQQYLKSEIARTQQLVEDAQRMLQSKNMELKASQQKQNTARNELEAIRREERAIPGELLELRMRVAKIPSMELAVNEAKEKINKVNQQKENQARQHSKELLEQKHRLDRQRDAEVQDVMRGREARKTDRRTYEDYRQVYEDSRVATNAVSDHGVHLEKMGYAGFWFLDKQPSISAQMKKYDPWFERKYPKLQEKFEQHLRDLRDAAEQSGQAIKNLRTEQVLMQEAVSASSHASRIQTRWHRLRQTRSKLARTDVLHWVLNEQPLRSRRFDNMTDVKRLLKSIERDRRNPALVSSHQRELDLLDSSRAQLDMLLQYHVKVRDGEALRALLTDSLEEKEAFIRASRADQLIKEALKMWRKFLETNQVNDADGDVSRADLRTVRTGFVNNRLEVFTRLAKHETLVRKRSMLEQRLDVVPAQREAKLDADIRERIALKNVEERRALQSLGIGSSRTSSFARPLRIPSRAPRNVPVESSPAPAAVSFLPAGQTSLPQPPLSAIAAIQIAIANLKKRRSQISPVDPERKEIDARLLALRLDAINANIATLKAKRISLRASAPNSPQLNVIDRELKKLIASKALNPRKRRGRAEPQSQAQGQSEEGGSASQDGEGVTTPQQPSALNLQPTSAKQAAHLGWPFTHRLFHTAGSRLSSGAEDTSTHSRASSGTDPFYYLLGDVGHRTMDVIAADSPLPTSHASTQTTQLCSSDMKSGEAKSSNDVGGAQPGEIGHKPATSEDRSQVITSSVMPLPTTTPHGASSDSAEDAAPSSEEVNSEDEVTLTYQIPAVDYRNAVIASRNTNAAFWTYKLYKNPNGEAPKVHFCTNFKTAEEQAQKFLNEPVIGFDIEWEPFTRKAASGIKDNVSLIQIATQDKIGLFQIARFAGDTAEQLMPPSLRQLLESDQTVKAGVNITGDARRMEQYLGVKMRGQFELSHLYKVVTFSNEPRKVNKKMLSLAAQVQEVLLLPLKKDDVRISTWAKQLNAQQVEYSASDAYAGFRLFHALDAKRKKMVPRPPLPAFHELHEPLVLGDGTVLTARPPARKPGTATAAAVKADELDDEAEEEYFDTVESFYTADSFDTPDESSQQITYPALPQLEDLSLLDAQSEQSPFNDSRVEATEGQPAAVVPNRTRAAPASTKRSTPSSPEVERAESWVSSWKAGVPAERTVKCGPAPLRAWHLWHEQSFDIKHVASLVGDPPLAPVTIASYVLQVIKEENLPFDAERVKEALDLMPSSVLWRYQKILDTVRARA